ncbi:uncharacterized protein LOC142998387 isoform X2 [Genypterus blacodes]|uniref:uncharacterized protein LOC142998387 isoform X2 n=1 Tax=Genypterus blacodes TaxID=154954 RepID=UPI003F75EE46
MDLIERRLAEEVRKYEHLYDTSSRKHQDYQVVVNSWREISAHVGLDVRECMRKWKYVRDKYVRVQKKVRRGGKPGSKVRAFAVFLSWLEPHIKHRSMEINYEDKEVRNELSCNLSDIQADIQHTPIETVTQATQPPWEGNLKNRLTNAERFSCSAPFNNMEEYPELMDCLPPGYTYHVCTYSRVSHSTDHIDFEATLRMPLRAVDEVKAWLKSTSVAWRVDHTRPSKGQRTIFKADYRCHHNTRPRGRPKEGGSSKNTNCPAKMKITLVRTEVYHGRQSRSTDPHVPDFPTMIKISSIHNHSMNMGNDTLQQDFGTEAAEKLTELFRAGHSPSSALDVLRYDLQVEHEGDDDPSLCPDLQFCYRLYHLIFRREHCSLSGKAMAEALERQISQYNSQCGSDCARLNPTADGRQFTVAICSPLMKRVHAGLKHSGEAVFMDSSGNMDRQHCHVFLLLTRSGAGGLPLGIVVTQSDKESVIFQGLQTLKSLLVEDAFSGRGLLGPQVFLTDDCQAERAAVHQAFPQTALLLSRFHLLQTVWSWLWNKENDIVDTDRVALFAYVKKILYAREETEAQSVYEEASQSPLMNSNNNFKEYLTKLYSRKECWALCYRAGDQANQSATTMLKDKILHRTKSFNAVQLFDFLTTRLNAYYTARITDTATGQWEGFQKSRFLVKNSDVKPENIEQINGSHFEVRSSSTPGQVYTVDLDVDMCSCLPGSSGGPCKHQASVAARYPGDCCDSLPVAATTREQLQQIATEPPRVGEQWDSMCQEFAAMVDNRKELHCAASAFIKTFNRLKGNPSMLKSAMHMFSTPTPTTSQLSSRHTTPQPMGMKSAAKAQQGVKMAASENQQIIPAKIAAPTQVSTATGRVSATSPTVMMVQLPNGQRVPVHGLIRAAQLPVILPIPVQTLNMTAAAAPPRATILQHTKPRPGQKILVPSNKLVQAALCDHQDYHIREDAALGGIKAQGPGEGPTSKWRSRLMRNRAAASENRRKKREQVKRLENHIAVLESQNKTLNEELKSFKDVSGHEAE